MLGGGDNIIFFTTQFIRNFEYKIDHISKTKNRKTVKISAKLVSEHCASSGIQFFLAIFHIILRILNDHISNTKNLKIDFLFVSEYCATFWTKNSIWSLFRSKNLSLIRNNPCTRFRTSYIFLGRRKNRHSWRVCLPHVCISLSWILFNMNTISIEIVDNMLSFNKFEYSQHSQRRIESSPSLCRSRCESFQTHCPKWGKHKPHSWGRAVDWWSPPMRGKVDILPSHQLQWFLSRI